MSKVPGTSNRWMSAFMAMSGSFSSRAMEDRWPMAVGLASTATTSQPFLAAARLTLPSPHARSSTRPETYGKAASSNGFSTKSCAATCFLNCVSKNSALRFAVMSDV